MIKGRGWELNIFAEREGKPANTYRGREDTG
jgi:hypothetical protein